MHRADNILPNRDAWDRHYTRKKSEQDYPDENLVRLLKANPGTCALDLGCGSGRHIQLLHDLGFSQIHATDVSETAVEHCRRKYRFAVYHPLEARMLRKNQFELPLSDESLDVVVAWGVLHYNPAVMRTNMLREISRILRPGGSFLGTLRSSRDTHFTANPDMSDAEIVLFSKKEATDLLKDYFCDVRMGHAERIPVGSTKRVSHWMFQARN